MPEEFTREQLCAALWEAIGGDMSVAVEIAQGWASDAIRDFAAPLREFADALDDLARSRR